MTIEVRQLVIKSTVQSVSESQVRQAFDVADLDALKQSILEECQRMIANVMAEARER